MYYGNFVFDEGDFCEGYDDTARCACCGKRYTEGYFDSEGDGDVPGGINEFFVEGERDCECTRQQLRAVLEEKDEIILDQYGRALLEKLQEVPGLDHLTEIDVCRISEASGKRFKDLCGYLIDNLVLWHVQAWSSYMKKKWG